LPKMSLSVEVPTIPSLEFRETTSLVVFNDVCLLKRPARSQTVSVSQAHDLQTLLQNIARYHGFIQHVHCCQQSEVARAAHRIQYSMSLPGESSTIDPSCTRKRIDKPQSRTRRPANRYRASHRTRICNSSSWSPAFPQAENLTSASTLQ
jgi:hypothetical protein